MFLDPSSPEQAFTLATVLASPVQATLLGTVLALILISAFISVVETAFLNMSKGKLRFLMEEGTPKADALSKLLENQDSIYQTMIVGNSIFNVAASALGAFWIVNRLSHLPLWAALAIALDIMTLMILVFAEVIPEAIGRRYPEKVSLAFLGITRVFLVLLRPFVVLFYGFSDLFLRIFGLHRSEGEQGMTKEELRNIIDGSVEEGLLDLEEKELIDNVTEFGLLRVDDVMTQRHDMVAMDITSSYEEVAEIIRNEKYSRIPVYRENTDDIAGILNVKDMVFVENTPDFNLEALIRPAFFTYEFKLVSDLFREMRRERMHLAIVLDEYGGTMGLVTIEDFLEAIVGDIDDEYDDEPETALVKVGDGTYEMDGATKLTDLASELGFAVESEDVDTIGGFIIEILGNFPKAGQVIPWKNMEFSVLETENYRVNKVRIRQLTESLPEAAGE